MGSLYPRNFEAEKTSLVNSFPIKEWFSNVLPLISTVKIAAKKSQNKIGSITIVVHVLTVTVRGCAVVTP